MLQSPPRARAFGLALLSLALFTACAQAQYPGTRYDTGDRIAPRGDIRSAAYSRLSLSEAKRSLASYRNESVRWGGIIASVENRHGETWIEIVEQPLDWRGRPEVDDDSAGRFIAILPGFAEPAIYRAGREITVVGRLLWPYKRRIGEHEYSYALLDASAHELWDAREERERIVYRSYRSYRTVDVYDPWFYPWPVYPRVYYEVHHHHHVRFPHPPVIIVPPPPVVVIQPAHPPRHPHLPHGEQHEGGRIPAGQEPPRVPVIREPAEDPRQIAEDTQAPVLTPGQLFPEDGQPQIQPVAATPLPPADNPPAAPELPQTPPEIAQPVAEPDNEPPLAEPDERQRERRLDEEVLRRHGEDGGKRPPIINEDPRPPRPVEDSLQPLPVEAPVEALRPLPEAREPQAEPQPEYRDPEPLPEYRNAPEPRPEYREPVYQPAPSYSPPPQPSYNPPPQAEPIYNPPAPEPQHEREHEPETPPTQNERIE